MLSERIKLLVVLWFTCVVQSHRTHPLCTIFFSAASITATTNKYNTSNTPLLLFVFVYVDTYMHICFHVGLQVCMCAHLNAQTVCLQRLCPKSPNSTTCYQSYSYTGCAVEQKSKHTVKHSESLGKTSSGHTSRDTDLKKRKEKDRLAFICNGCFTTNWGGKKLKSWTVIKV